MSAEKTNMRAALEAGGDALGPVPAVNPVTAALDAQARETLAQLHRGAAGWEPEACLVGGVRAGEIVSLCLVAEAALDALRDGRLRSRRVLKLVDRVQARERERSEHCYRERRGGLARRHDQAVRVLEVLRVALDVELDGGQEAVE